MSETWRNLAREAAIPPIGKSRQRLSAWDHTDIKTYTQLGVQDWSIRRGLPNYDEGRLNKFRPRQQGRLS